MADNTSTTSFRADISQLKSAMQEASRQVRLANSEFRAATAGMDDWTKSADGLQAKLSSLDTTLSAQKRQLSILEDTLEATTKEYGENSAAADKVRIQINNQKAAIAKTEHQMETYEDALDNVGNETSDLAKQTEASSKSIKTSSKGFTVLKGVMANLVTDGIRATISGIKTLGKTLATQAKQTAEYGDTIDKASQRLGLSAEGYQKWDYVMNLAGTDMNSLGAGMKTLVNRFDEAKKGTEESQKMFEKLGISMKDLKGMSQDELFDATIKGFQGMGESADRAALANDLLGRSGQKLGPLFNQSAKSTEELKKQAEDYGMVLSDKTVKASAAFQDSLTTMGNTFNGLKNRLAGGFLPVLTQVTDGFAQLFKGDTKGSIKLITDGISGVINKITAGAPKFLEFGAQIITSLVQGIVNNLPKLAQGAGQAMTVVESFLLKNLPAVSQMAMNLLIKAVNGLIGALPAIIKMLGELINNIVIEINRQAPTLIKAVVSVLPKLVDSLLSSLDMLVDTGLQLILGLADGILEGLPKLVKQLPRIIKSIVSFLMDNIPKIFDASVELLLAIVDALPTIVDSLTEALPTIIDTIVTELTKPKAMTAIIKGYVKLFGGIIKAVPKIQISLLKAWAMLLASLITSIIDNKDKITKSIKTMFSAAFKGIADIIVDAEEVGADIVAGVVKGIKNARVSIGNAVKNVGKKITEAFKDFFGIHSPSVLMQNEIGKWLLPGLVKGVEDSAPTAIRKLQGISKSLVSSMADSFADSTDTLKNVINGVVTVATNELLKANTYDFSGLSESVTGTVTDTISQSVSYLIDKASTEADARITKYENKITKLEKKKSSKADKIQAKSDKKIKKLEKKLNATDSKSEQAKIKQQIADEKKATARLIKASNKKYDKLIKAETKAKNAYQKASEASISSFSDALNEYATSAESLINETISGISDTYQAKYDDLISKQDTLVGKLKGMGDLFDISSAGVLSINDINAQTESIKAYADKLAEIKGKVSEDLFNEIAELDVEQGSAFIDQLLKMSSAELQAYSDAYDEKMRIAEELGSDIYKSDIEAVASDYSSAVASAMAELPDQLTELGKQSMQGFIDGLAIDSSYLDSTVKGIVNNLIKNFKDELGIASPSKVMRKLGEYTGEGFVEGLTSITKELKKASTSLSSIATNGLSAIATSNISGSGSNSNTVTNNYNLVQNNTSPKSLTALETYQARRRQLSMAKLMGGA